VPPLVRGEPIRQWSFNEYRGDALERVEVDSGIQVGGVLHELHDFGVTSRDSEIFAPDGTSIPSDGIATGQISSSPDGGTYWVGAEAPRGNANLPEDPIGGESRLTQTQSFIKRAPDASLSFTVSAAYIEVTDQNDVLARLCPVVHADGLRCDLVKGEVFLDVVAFTVPPAPDIVPFDRFFHVAGGATVSGFAENWDSEAWSPTYSQVPLWDIEDFEFVIDSLDGHREGLVLMILTEPLTFTVDLSSVEVGQAFTLQSDATATTYNRIAGAPSEFGTSASAFLRDPQGIGGTTVSFDGLEPTDDPGVAPPAEEPVTPAPCTTDPSPDPAAGVLQFSADAYTIAEANPTPTVTVQRTGGSAGAVTATIRTSDRTALAGTDYSPVETSVFFADGDATPRVVEVPILQDEVSGEPDKSLDVTLSEPGGCAALGSPTTSQLTIRDDDVAPPPPPASFGLDPTFGAEGKATTIGFGGDRSAMALQADGKIVMVGGTFTDFVLARFNSDGTLDEGFDGDGMVTTDIGGGFAQEEALGVAIQPDGKIVVAGYTNRVNVAIVRYNPDGSLDETFGTGGIVSSGVTGVANDVTIQPDGKIVIAGSVSRDNLDDFADFVVARYLTDGTLDETFGGVGQLSTDVGRVTNEAQNVVVQSDGAIVVSGSSLDPGSNGVGIDHHTDIVRYLADGSPDPSFGSGGSTTLDALVGTDLALQPDGRLVLVGTVDTAVPPATPSSVTEFSVMRLESNGTPDLTFGTAGTSNVSVSARSSELAIPARDSATAVALDVDGRIVVAGATSSISAKFAITRLDTDGSVDTAFADAGVFVIDFLGSGAAAESVAIQNDGKIVIGGLARDGVDGYGVARVLV
jgi:uncharacterized delta-60 repeat protein